MATKTVDIKDFPATAKKLFLGPINKSFLLMKELSVKVDQNVSIRFASGGTSGGKRWSPLSPKTLKTKAGTWKIRYGTDLTGRPKGTYKPFELRKGVRRYSGSSIPLQASGAFRKSFMLWGLGKNSFTYGTRHQLAKKIMSNPTRNVLVYDNTNKKQYTKIVFDFIDRNLKA